MLWRRDLKFFVDQIALKYELVELTWLNTFFQIPNSVTDGAARINLFVLTTFYAAAGFRTHVSQ